MGISLLQLAKKIRKKVKNLDKEMDQVVKDYSLDLVAELAIRTPADTSKALSNWRVGLGAPPTGEIGPQVPGSFASTKTQSVTVTIAEAESKIKRKRLKQPIFVSNNVDYIDDLNKGTSTQAPRGFIQAAKIAVKKRNPKVDLNRR